MAAIICGQVQLVELLLGRGASIDLQNKDGHTALTYAAGKGNPSIVSVLLRAGARADLHDKAGLTALELADRFTHEPSIPEGRRQGYAEAARLLRQHATAQTTQEAAPPPTDAESDTLVGQRVRLEGLSARADLNGKCGTARGLVGNGSRLSLQLDGVEELVSVSAANLVRVDASSTVVEQDSVAAVGASGGRRMTDSGGEGIGESDRRDGGLGAAQASLALLYPSHLPLSTSHPLPATYHLPPATCYLPPITCHLLPVATTSHQHRHQYHYSFLL